ncbi:MAG: hypothetical protein JO227_16275 [Acetobacteraceae bacterium]|nr:hypothetical protein [Acetobacteraceae bacterium]
MLFTNPSAEPALAAVIPIPVLNLLLPLLQQSFPVPAGVATPTQLRESLAHMLNAYNPESAAEASMAAMAILMQGQAAHCCRRAEETECQSTADRYRLMAMRMLRVMQGNLRLMLRLQARREKQEKALAARTGYGPMRHFVPLEPVAEDTTPCNVRADAEGREDSPGSRGEMGHETPPPLAGLGREADQGRGEGSDAPEPCEPTPPPRPLPQGEGESTTAKRPGYPAWADMTEAEQYAVIYPDRAVLIRDHSGVPGWVTFDRPSADLARALIEGRGPVFDELDSIANEMRAKTPCTVKDHSPPRLSASVVNLPSGNPTQTGGDPATAEAERFITEHPNEAAMIRAFRGAPDWPEFNAPAPAVVRAIILGRGPAFDALDRVVAAAGKPHAT